MKKLFLTALALTAFAISANAQDFKIGAKAGLNIAHLRGDDAEEFGSRTSFVAGAVAQFPISEKFSFQPELLYSAQGAKEGNETLKFDYLNVPLMGKYYVADGFSIQAGPQVGFLLSAKAKGEEGDVSAEIDVKDELKNLDFGLNFGLGYEFQNGLFIDGRYNLGLSNIVEDDDVEEVYNGVFQFTLGYFFF
ncbi:PorT family protein [Galbibacter sp. BG1]|uniref:porin family protein n=1 Tax=Galbibacter sp. BG1 TaxID=1170699 RepID=UPI0015BA3F70|nr:porin family protein [Galbibacter sp. BG1]QLE00464.1 PorT family protein [Galbibacter sp. BG1]